MSLEIQHILCFVVNSNICSESLSFIFFYHGFRSDVCAAILLARRVVFSASTLRIVALPAKPARQ